MSRLKQPSTLEDLAIEALGTYVYNVSQNEITAIDSGRTLEVNTNELHRYLYSDLPSILYQKITIHMFSVINKIIEYIITFNKKLFGTAYRELKIFIKNITLASIYPDVTVLDLTVLPIFAFQIVTEHISRFEKLHTLIITEGWYFNSINLFRDGIHLLRFLVYLKMERACDDAIINALGTCCSKTIQQLHVRYSHDVTNASVESLTKCQKLTHLSVSNTSMTSEGFIQLLRTIQQYKNSDDTAKGFLQISVGRAFKWAISSSQLNEIAITSPILKELEIVYLEGDLETLSNLTNLEILKIVWCNTHTCNLDGFLRLRGSNLRTLNLLNVEDPRDLMGNMFDLTVDDPIDLISIMNHCRNLKELKLLYCDIMDIAPGQLETVASAFQNLEILDIVGYLPTVPVEHILYKCLNIKVLRLEIYQCEINDEFILRLLSRNLMKKLTTLSLSSPDLTMRSVNAILQQCPLLDTLEYLDRWHGVTDMELSTVRQNIKDTNQDLQINSYGGSRVL